MGLAYRRRILTPPRLVLVAVIMAIAGVAVTKAEKFTIRWCPNENYTDWDQKNNNSVHVGDWLVFQYTANLSDVILVNQSGFNNCDASNPISNNTKGRTYAIHLNEPRPYYFICSFGYCYGGMKLAVVAYPQPDKTQPQSDPNLNMDYPGTG